MNKLIPLLAVVALAAGTATASPYIIQPDETAGKDTIVYEFLANTNLDPWGVLGVTKAKDHNLHTLIQFDLNGVPYEASQITSATLNLRVALQGDVLGGEVPTEDYPIEVQVYRTTQNWNESTVTWSTKPSYDSSTLIDSQVIDTIDIWVSFDVTDLVKDWVSGSVSNFGFYLVQTDEVRTDTDKAVGATFYGAGYTGNTSYRPYLQIVPEPTSLGVLGLGAGVLLRRRRQ